MDAPASHTVARESGRPFLGRCGGFQHALIEYARNVRHGEADHAESNPNAACRSCRDWPARWAAQRNNPVRTRFTTQRDLRRNEIVESYQCNFGLNSRYQSLLDTAVLADFRPDENGEVRAVEMMETRFSSRRCINRNNPPLAARRIR